MSISFTGDNYLFSNFSPHSVTIFGFTFPNGEAAFHALKDPALDHWLSLVASTSPAQAKKMGRQCTLRPDWDTFRETGMRLVISAKTAQNQDVWSRLMETGDELMIETNHWHDQYWGDCTCPRHEGTPGKNMLGQIWMDQRNYWRRRDV